MVTQTVIMEKSHLSYCDIHTHVKMLALKIQASNWMPSVIVGVSRGGMLPATLLSHSWRLPMKALNVSLRDNAKLQPDHAVWLEELVQSGKRVLVMDDINDSGATIHWIKQDWQNRVPSASFSDHVRFAVLLNKSTSTESPEYVAKEISTEKLETWWIFPWEHLE